MVFYRHYYFDTNVNQFILDFNSTFSNIMKQHPNFFSKDFRYKDKYIWRGISCDFNGTLDNTLSSVLRIWSFLTYFMAYKKNNSVFDDFFSNEVTLEQLSKKILEVGYSEIEYNQLRIAFGKKYEEDTQDVMERRSKGSTDCVNLFKLITKLF